MSNLYDILDQRAHEVYATGSYTEEFHAASTRVNTLLSILELAESRLRVARELAAITDDLRPVIAAATLRDYRARDVEAAIEIMRLA